MTIKFFRETFLIAAAGSLLAGCVGGGAGSGGGAAGGGTGGAGGGAGQSLPVTAKGRAIAFRVASDFTSGTNSYTGLPTSSHNPTSTAVVERSARGGIEIEGSATEDTNPAPYQGNAMAPAALISASSPDTLENGTAIAGMKDAKGNVYFENGNFANPQAEDANAAVSTVGVYNIYDSNNQFVEQIVMKYGTTVRYREGATGDPNATYAVGFIGENTTNMPKKGTATYKGFYESGQSYYNDNGTMKSMYFKDGTVELVADFDKGKVTGGISGAALNGNDNGTPVDLNSNIDGLAINADINGSNYDGTAMLVDAAGNQVGTSSYNEAIGAFFGPDASETAAAVLIEGNADLNGSASDYVISGTLGGVKK